MGKSYAHPLVVLIVRPNEQARVRVGVAAGRSLGGAVARNKAKRHLREAMRSFLPQANPGWDIVLIARHSMREASYQDISNALELLLNRSKILSEDVTSATDSR